MKHEQTNGIVLRRINYGEADRIITILTDSHGKITVMARGVRKEKSKLAGGIELFSVSQISFIPGRRDMGTLVSSRLQTHYKNIVKDIGRTNLAFELIKQTDKVTEANCEPAYFELLEQALTALNDNTLAAELIEAWFTMRLLKLMGHEPNLTTDHKGQKLQAGQAYNFDYEHMAFLAHQKGKYTDKHIKFLRLMLVRRPQQLNFVTNSADIQSELRELLITMVHKNTG